MDFDQNKITEAIWKAAQSVGGTDRTLAEKISSQVNTVLEVFFKVESPAPTVEQIQDLVEKILIENGHAKTAKAYILYREEHKKLRRKKEEILGVEKLKLTTVDGQNRQLGDFIILDIADDLEAIFEGMKETVVIHQNGEKACVNFSVLRAKGSKIKGKHEASGPIAFMKLYDTALSTIKKGSENQSRHVILLSTSHPDILEFLDYEEKHGKLENFTLMVEVTELFMQTADPNAELSQRLIQNTRENKGPKPILIEYTEKYRKHSSIQVNLPFDDDSIDNSESKTKHQAQEINLPPIETLA